MSEVANLIARLEAAEAGSAELDALVWAEVLPTTGQGLDGYGLVEGAIFVNEAEDDGSVNQYAKLASGSLHRRCRRPAPHYTRSLDAALTLIPEGWILNDLGDDAEGYVGKLRIFGATAELTNGAKEAQGQAPTRPLALVIAALKARAA